MQASAIAGACAGFVSSVVTCPLDVVKTKLQAQEGRAPSRTATTAIASRATVIGGDIAMEQGVRYLGIKDILQKIWRSDGIRGFYRGLGPTIFGYLPTWAIYFTVYDSSKEYLAKNASASGEEEFLNHIISAMTAGAASTTCTSPLWVVKTRFMLQSAKDTSVKPYRHTCDAFVQIYRSEGLRGFYKGLIPSLFGVSHVAVQFPLYETFKSWARQRLRSDELPPSTILLCSSSAKMIASVTTYPHEVLRTRLQMQPRSPSSSVSLSSTIATAVSDSRSQSQSPSQAQSQPYPKPTLTAEPPNRSSLPDTRQNSHNQKSGKYSGVIQAAQKIAREEGIRGFYKGMTVNLVRTVPSSALTILTYEVIMQHLTHNDSMDLHANRSSVHSSDETSSSS